MFSHQHIANGKWKIRVCPVTQVIPVCVQLHKSYQFLMNVTVKCVQHGEAFMAIYGEAMAMLVTDSSNTALHCIGASHGYVGIRQLHCIGASHGYVGIRQFLHCTPLYWG